MPWLLPLPSTSTWMFPVLHRTHAPARALASTSRSSVSRSRCSFSCDALRSAACSSATVCGPESAVQLDSLDRERCAQLMAGSVYQPAFSLDRVFDPVEHLVQGGAQ